MMIVAAASAAAAATTKTKTIIIALLSLLLIMILIIPHLSYLNFDVLSRWARAIEERACCILVVFGELKFALAEHSGWSNS